MGELRACVLVALVFGACGGGDEGGHDGAVPDAGPRVDAAPLSEPAPGEWPMFKRDLRHTGVRAGA